MENQKKSAGKKPANKNTAKKQPQKQAQQSIAREIAAFICLFFAIFTLLGAFGVKALFIDLLCTFLRGLLGAGFYVTPLAFFMAFWLLISRRRKRTTLRIVSVFLVALFVGALGHVVSCKLELTWNFSILKHLYLGGVHREAGGLLAGLLGQILLSVFGKFCGILLAALALLIAVLATANMTVFSLIRAYRNRPRPVQQQKPEEPVDRAEQLVNFAAQKHIARVERRREASEFDLPVDEPPRAEKKKRREKPAPAPQETVAEPEAPAQSEPVPVEKRPAQPRAPFDLPVDEPPAALPDLTPPDGTEAAGTQTAFEEEPALIEPIDVTDFAHDTPEVVEESPVVVPPELPPQAEPALERVKAKDAARAAAEIGMEIASTSGQTQPVYQFPSCSLLKAVSAASLDRTDEMKLNRDLLAAKLSSFGIDANITDIICGPTVTRYELKLESGVKLSKITGLADDIALALGSTGVRISAIPDKMSVVGIEVPNKTVRTVWLREVIESREFQSSKSKLSFAVGEDIGGNRIVGDIAKLPHLLIAGTTGSGKSVCMNSLIISLLYKSTPDEVKLIMVDPKMVELGIYNGIPHLLIPVVTDPKKAAGALQWAVTEMMRRYRTLSDSGVREIDSYNKLASHTEEMETMPRLVVVIDELADLMLVAAKEVEESICRVAQMGRAAGVHLVIATQRPSADVITGLLKANIPSRIAFAVASSLESRIILDTQGAEKLVGKGDMLFAPLGQGKPRRVQGCFLTDAEVQAVVDSVKQFTSAQYSAEVQEQIEKNASQSGKGGAIAAAVGDDEDDCDELLPQAVEVILETGQASVSMLQRRLKLGYARAARIVDEMEERGIVGPFEGSKPRQLLITKEQWAQMQNGGAPDDNPPVEKEI